MTTNMITQTRGNVNCFFIVCLSFCEKSSGDCGWVDFVQWTGPSPAQACPERSRRDPANWQQIDYKHDVAGRRVEKKLVVSLSNPTASIVCLSRCHS